MTIRTLVVGTGFGCRVHVPALRAAGFEVVGLVATNPERLAKKAADAGIGATFTDLDSAITTTGAELVTIATMPSTHAALAQTAIARGCHVLCEKPFASNATEAEVLVAAAEAAGVVNMIAHEFRWLPERALFGRAIAEGLIGEPRFLVIDQFMPLCASPEARLPKWWFDEAAGGGWLGAGGSHLIDQVRAWLGEFRSVSANLMVVSDRGDVAEDSFSMRFLMQSGVEGSMQQSAGAWGDMLSVWRCAGSTGTVWIERGQVKVADKTGTRDLPVPDDLALPPAASHGLPHFEAGPLIRLYEMLGETIAGKAPSSPVTMPMFRDGLAAMRVMDGIRASAASGGHLQTL